MTGEIKNEILLKSHGGEWFKRWFNSSFYHKLYSERNEKEAADFIDELIKELQPGPNACMLDLGCGNGRHSKYLSSKGFDVTGIDLASSSIREARKWQNDSLRFYRQDMRTRFGESYFDFVLSFFTSFGYFDNPEDDDVVLGNITRALKPGGMLMMDYINAPFAEKKTIASEQKEIDGIVYSITRWNDEKYFYKKIAIGEDILGEPIEYTERVRKYSLDDFYYRFAKHGLQVEQVFGDYQLNEYEKETSPRIILVAGKAHF